LEGDHMFLRFTCGVFLLNKIVEALKPREEKDNPLLAIKPNASYLIDSLFQLSIRIMILLT